MQSIAAAAGLRHVELQAQIVPSNEPVEGMLRLLIPVEICSCPMGFEAGSNRGLGLNWLLVEVGAGAATLIKPVAADWPQVSLFRRLLACKPTQGLETAVQDSLVTHCPSTHNQRVGESGVVVGKLFLKPVPIGMRMPVIKLHQTRRECLACLVYLAIAA